VDCGAKYRSQKRKNFSLATYDGRIKIGLPLSQVAKKMVFKRRDFATHNIQLAPSTVWVWE
jgi:hypothetical protein